MRLHTLRLIFMFMFYQVIIYGQQVKFSYQAVFRDSSGELLTERLVGIRLSILNEKSELQYTERHQIKTNNLGLGTLILGDGTEKTGILESIQWGKGALDLKTEVDVLGGKNYGIQSMAPILSVPYAVYTGIADSLRGGRLLPKDAKNGEILYWDGQTWQKLSAGKPGQWLGVSPDGNLQWQFPVPSPGIKDMEILKDNSKIQNPITTDTLKLGRGKPDIGLNKDIQNKDSLFTEKDVIQQFEADKIYQTLSNESIGSEPANNPEITDRLEKKLLANLPVLTTTVPGSITTSTANGGGVISSDGGAPVTARGLVWSTSPAPALTLSTKTSNGGGMGSFISSLTSLSPNTTYYVRAYATNSVGTGYGNVITFTTTNSFNVMNIPCSETPTVKDVDGNSYKTVQIGTQCWMQSNLKVTKYRNGQIIPTGLNNSVWSNTTSGAYAIYGNNNANDITYGKLYNWHAVKDGRGLCPTGWHIPSDTEWTTLVTFLGGENAAGGKMKLTTGWNAPNSGATNESGFSGLPGGYRNFDGSFFSIRTNAFFWSVTENTNSVAWFRVLYDYVGYFERKSTSKRGGLSVRCIKDALTTSIPTLTTSAISAIATTTATGGGNVTASGGATVTARGVVWSTSPVPTISLSTKTGNGEGTGSFTSSLTGLAPNTTYYVRAYATNSAGTAYGNELSFKTTAAVTVPILTTSAISVIATTTATGGGNITADGGAPVTMRGVIWSTSPTPTISLSTKTSNGGGTGSFTSSLTGLTPNTTYYVRAYATSSAGTAYGNEVTFKTTTAVTVPILTTSTISAITATTATGGGNITADGGAPVTMRGVIWSTSPTPTISLSTKTSNGGGTGSFTSSLTGLTPNTTYYVRAYATSSAGTAYGNEVSFKTTAVVAVPILTTSAISAIATTTANGGGNITTDGGTPVTMRGVIWSTSPVPTISLSTKTSNGGGTGSFTSSLTGLAPNTTYYVRAYATSSAGTAYGNEVSFKTTAAVTVPILTTSAISAIAATTATGGGNVTASGGATVTARGVVWSTSPVPTISLSTKTSNGGGTGSFTSSLTGLAPNTTYYVRAYATSSAGTAYGNEVTFKTTAAVTVPILTTSAISGIATTTANGGGNITTDGGTPVTMRGVIWSTSPVPTISLSTKTSNGGGTGSFTSSLTGLAPNTTYYVRAYATSSAGTAYGNEVTFKTTSVPTITTTSISSITSTTGIGGGNITTDGGSTITARGVVWSTNRSPKLPFGRKTINGEGIGSFTSELNSLDPNTWYFVRAYATNSEDTYYGNELSFKTLEVAGGPTVITAPISIISTNSATGGGNVTSQGVSAVTDRGVVWSMSPVPTISLSMKTSNGEGMGSFTSSLTKLSPNTTYYVRAYATNSSGTVYGEQITFNTSPELLTSSVSEVTANSAKCGGFINAGNAAILDRGVVWSTSPSPTILLSTKISNGGGMGSFSSSLTGLSPNTSYYIRAYSTNSSGTGYGEQRTFSTLPQLTTTPVSEVSTNSAKSGGNITPGGNLTIINYGLVWSTSPAPKRESANSTSVAGGLSAGSFTSSLTGLAPNTTYYIRAFAANSGGTAYGNEVSFKTTGFFPSLTTSIIKDINLKTATGGGNVTNQGSYPVTERGVVWSTSPTPTILLTTKKSSGSGTSSFTTPLTNLSPNTTYYVRAYATNSVGTGYGNEVSFKTYGGPCPGVPTVKDIDGNTYNTVHLGTQCWTKENLRVSRYNDGTSIPLDASGGTSGDGINNTWSSWKIGARTIYQHSQSYYNTYGYLYNGWAALGISGSTFLKNICPLGWHVPRYDDFYSLEKFLGDSDWAGGKLKSTNTNLWSSVNIKATNESGFSALPGGLRDFNGEFGHECCNYTISASFWTSSWSLYAAIDEGAMTMRYLRNVDGYFSSDNSRSPRIGASVRCLRD